jgi:lincosamide nucleotidyltransferase A/C/D/E
MKLDDVLAAVRALADGGVPVWVAGGWGIDALVGYVTRQHRDLDLVVPADLDEAAIAVLAGLGYVLDEDQRPARFVMRAPDGRVIDMHPVAFDETGHGIQQGFDGVTFHYAPSGFTSGTIGGVTVPCLAVDQQIAFHVGYEPSERDRRDMAVLRDRLGVELPPPY